jgi:hypothetical protein
VTYVGGRFLCFLVQRPDEVGGRLADEHEHRELDLALRVQREPLAADAAAHLEERELDADAPELVVAAAAAAVVVHRHHLELVLPLRDEEERALCVGGVERLGAHVRHEGLGVGRRRALQDVVRVALAERVSLAQPAHRVHVHDHDALPREVGRERRRAEGRLGHRSLGKQRFGKIGPKSMLLLVQFGRALYLPPTTPLLHTSLRPAVLASAPSNPIPQSLTGASRGAIGGVTFRPFSLLR